MRFPSGKLRTFPILLSASLPKDLIGTSRAQDLYDAIVAVVGGVFSADGSLIFGGHPSITPLVHRVASAFEFKEPRIKLFQLARFRDEVPPEVYDQRVFGEVVWMETGSAIDSTSIEVDLRKMRREMVKASRAAVFIGGNTKSFLGTIPGIRDEFEQFISRHPEGPAYLLGFLGGEVQELIRSMKLKGISEPNRLSNEELSSLHSTDDIDFATSLIFADLRRYATQPSSVIEDKIFAPESLSIENFAQPVESKHVQRSKLEIESIRNIGIIAVTDYEKTTAVERILHMADIFDKTKESFGATAREIDRINPEPDLNIALASGSTGCLWERNGVDYRINIIGTPSHIDSVRDIMGSLKSLDGAVVVYDNVNPIDRSDIIWRFANSYDLPRICFINDLYSFERVANSIIDQLGATPVALQIPITIRDQLTGVVDLIAMKGLIWGNVGKGTKYYTVAIPSDLLAEATAARQKLVEAVASLDDVLMEKYLVDDDISEEEIRAVLRRGTISQKVVPILIGSAYKNEGVQQLLDTIVDYLPSPLDISAVEGTNPMTGETEERPADAVAPFAALIFKTLRDRELGQMSFARIYSGSIHAGSLVYNATKDSHERADRLIRMHLHTSEELESASAGEVVAIGGLKGATTGDTICDEDQPIVIETVESPKPFLRVAIEANSPLAQAILVAELSQLLRDDPSFNFSTNRETGRTVLAGISEAHLKRITDRLTREFGVDINVGKLQVVYFETITQAARGKGVYKDQINGVRQYGHVEIEIEPAPNQGLKFIDEIKGHAIPRRYMDSIEQGIKAALQRGVVAGYELVDIEVRLVSGSYHEVDSNERAFHIASALALQDAVKQAKPILVEPIMWIEVITPGDHAGTIMGELISRRARIQGIESRPSGTQIFTAQVPMAEMIGFSEALGSATSGRGSFNMQLDLYDQVPADQVSEIIAKLGSVRA